MRKNRKSSSMKIKRGKCVSDCAAIGFFQVAEGASVALVQLVIADLVIEKEK
jgi:hypothetical protein